jgi:hypothetical protein
LRKKPLAFHLAVGTAQKKYFAAVGSKILFTQPQHFKDVILQDL